MSRARRGPRAGQERAWEETGPDRWGSQRPIREAPPGSRAALAPGFGASGRRLGTRRAGRGRTAAGHPPGALRRGPGSPDLGRRGRARRRQSPSVCHSAPGSRHATQALRLTRRCSWLSGCVSGTRLSLKPLICPPENNQLCPGPRPLPAALARPRAPAAPPRRVFSLLYHHSFLSLFLPLPPPRAGPSIRPPSSSTATRSSPLSH